MSTLTQDELAVLHFDFDFNAFKKPNSRPRPLLQPLPPAPNDTLTPTSGPLLASISSHNATRVPSNSYRHSTSRVKPPGGALSFSIYANSSLVERPKTEPSSKPTIAAGTILPVGVKRGLHPRRYLWDGHRLVAVELQDLQAVANSAENAAKTPGNAIKRGFGVTNGVLIPLPTLSGAVARWMHDARAAFFPNPSEVSPDYWEWCKWRAVHRMFSSMATVFGTQSLLLAVGVGAKKTLPAAAAINWVLKDGLGRLGRLSVATRFGESFDSDLKRFRYSSSMLYAGALSLDYLTPLFPQYFLPMAALANVGKSVGLTTYISTQPAFHRSFAMSENLADISAKTQAQQMAVDTLGLMAAVTLSALCARHSEAARRTLPLIALPFLAGGDLFSISQELRSIHLRTLNKERAEIIAAAWLSTGHVPSPKQVSARERLILPPETALGPLPLTISSLEDVLKIENDVERFLKQPQGQKYVLTGDAPGPGVDVADYCCSTGSTFRSDGTDNSTEYNNNIRGNGIPFWPVAADWRRWLLPGKRQQRGALRAALRADAASQDVLEVILRTAKLRKVLSEGVSKESTGGLNQSFVESGVPSVKEVKQFVDSVSASGWQVAPFMLSSSEKRFYCKMMGD